MSQGPKDPKKEFDDLMNDLADRQKSHMIAFRLGFILHRTFGIHILLLSLINVLVTIILVGVTDTLDLGMIDTTMTGLIFMMLLFTCLEVIIKLVLIRFFLKYLIISFGLIAYITNILIFLFSQFLIDDFNFIQIESSIFIFTILFMLLRLPFSVYVRRAKWIQGG